MISTKKFELIKTHLPATEAKLINQNILGRESQRDVVYLVTNSSLPSYMSLNVGGGGVAGLSSCAQGAEINFGDLTPYLTYDPR
jgi:hypothetical protein